MRRTLCEYPDPVVAAYMRRVQALTPNARATLGEPVWPRVRKLHWFFIPKLLYYWSMAALMAHGAVVAATRTDDSEARVAYQLFWNQLRKNKWSLVTRGKVAWGLLAVRSRANDATGAVRLYRRMETLIPRASIGWAESATT